MEQSEPLNTDPRILKLLEDQENLPFAIVGGLASSIIFAIIWAIFTVLTEYQVGIVAILIGLAIGYWIRFVGAGRSYSFSVIGASCALFACLLGNLFSQVGFISNYQALSPVEVMSALSVQDIVDIMVDSFSPMDLVFYGIAAYEGFKFAIRPVTLELTEKINENPVNAIPENNKFRKPAVYASLFLLMLSVYPFLTKPSGHQVYYDEFDNIQAEGDLNNGLADGEWTYYHSNGNIQAIGIYENGLEQGDWEYYDSLKNKLRIETYVNGRLDGLMQVFNSNGILITSGNYVNGRMDGDWEYYYDDGQVSSKGRYVRDKAEGMWKYFYSNGQVSSEGIMKSDKYFGDWKFYDSISNLTEHLIYDADENHKTIFSSYRGVGMVKNGQGYHKSYYPNGELYEEGEVKDGYREGEWKIYYEDGQIMHVLQFHMTDPPIWLNSFLQSGEEIVSSGNGKYKSYFDGTTEIYEEGLVEDGYRTGKWNNYYEDGSLAQSSNYNDGKLHGPIAYYHENGQLSVSGEYVNGKESGTFSWYYFNSNLETEVLYENGEKEGEQKFYNELGNHVKSEFYKNGHFEKEEVY